MNESQTLHFLTCLLFFVKKKAMWHSAVYLIKLMVPLDTAVLWYYIIRYDNKKPNLTTNMLLFLSQHCFVAVGAWRMVFIHACTASSCSWISYRSHVFLDDTPHISVSETTGNKGTERNECTFQMTQKRITCDSVCTSSSVSASLSLLPLAA